MKFKDYYEILGVDRAATQDRIKKAYRKLARKYHPDVSASSDAGARFKEVGEAYEVLKDPEKRAAYDRLGSDFRADQEFRPPPGWGAEPGSAGGGYTTVDASQFSDFFEALFGGAGGGGFRAAGDPFPHRGEDIDAKLSIDLEDAYRGSTRQLTLESPEVGPDGRISRQTRTLNVQVPKGVKQGQKIRLAGQGVPGRTGQRGDLYLQIEFRPHRNYRVDGADVYLDLPVAPWEAGLGATVKVPTPSGVVDLKVPPGSQQGRRLRLKGRGIPAKSPGDLYLILQVALPPADEPKIREIYQRMREETEFDPRAGFGV